MIPITCKITNFSSYTFVYFFDNFSCLICVYCFAGKNSWRVSIITYRNTDKPVCFVLSFVAFVTQAKNSMKNISAIHPAITENMENTLVKCAPPKINYWKAHNTSYSAMFCLLHSNIGKEQHEKYLCNLSSHTENTENILVKHAPHISIRESHSVSISAMANSFHTQ